MILDKKININIVSSNYKYYNSLGYDVKVGDKIDIKVEELSKGSQIKINCKCDNCDSIKMMSYMTYLSNTKNMSEKYYCNKCGYLKAKETNIKKYGVDNPMKLDSIKETLSNNNIEKYGVKNPMQVLDFKNKQNNKMLENYGVVTPLKSDIIKNKVKQTNLEKYGVENVFQSDEIKNKIKETNLENLGVEHPSQNETIKQNKISKRDDKLFEKYDSILSGDYKLIEYKNSLLKIKHNVCGYIFEIYNSNYFDRVKKNNCLCTKCFPISEQKSIKEKEIVNWLKELDIDFIESDRDILVGKELDIYIPSHNLAIEYNGLYWHSELYKNKKYHLEKSLKCQEKGIHLIHIWEDEWLSKQDIVKSIISNRLGLISNKIYARQCEIKVIDDSKLIRDFLDSNHIQGYSQSSIKLGLYHQNELVSLMTFGYRHTNSKKEFELIRFCNKKNMNVVGAASKLFKHFIENFEYKELISYSDFRLFDGKMYKDLGFNKKHLSLPDYFWTKDSERKHRFNFNKRKLVKEGYDPNKTEVEIMHERGYYRIYGCGQIRWEWKG
jgi:hypothetical protein